MDNKNYDISYDVKMIFYGDYYEIYKYTKKILKNKKTKVITKKRTKDGQRSTFSLNRTRNTVRRLISANFTSQSTFLTLTFEENLQDARIANACFTKFIRYLRHYIRSQGEFDEKKFKYLAVIEFQKRGAIHYHVICTLPFISRKIMRLAWPYGFYKMNKTKHVKNIGAYVSKYLYKDVNDSRLKGQKAYFCSRNLTRPVEITDKNTIRTVLSNYGHRTGGAKKVFSSKFDNNWTGRVYYNQYKRGA